jgi:transposase
VDEVNTRPISEERRRIKGLEREIQQLKMEKEILKKATTLLMPDSIKSLR